VIAGKGHETYQIVGPSVLPFDDREVARQSLSSYDPGREAAR
jgi:UDP-N-acetylmuramoyl-L-alanyl-D-glutamate--2,6-diaminopimelate ligase